MVIIRQNFGGVSGFAASCGHKVQEGKESVGRGLSACVALVLGSNKPEGELEGLQTRDFCVSPW